MKIFVCKVCGYIHKAEAPPERCPMCGAGIKFFEEKKEPNEK